MPTGIYKRDKNKQYGFAGKKHSEETKKKIGLKSVGRKANWKTGKTKSKNGYIWIYMPDHPCAMHGKYVYEHRLIMEKAIGRFLEGEEEVHHVNGIKDDNRLENLELFENKSNHRKKDWENKRYRENGEKYLDKARKIRWGHND
jgi:5-methylcytosine-specific restriction endonuclease McrA